MSASTFPVHPPAPLTLFARAPSACVPSPSTASPCCFPFKRQEKSFTNVSAEVSVNARQQRGEQALLPYSKNASVKTTSPASAALRFTPLEMRSRCKFSRYYFLTFQNIPHAKQRHAFGIQKRVVVKIACKSFKKRARAVFAHRFCCGVHWMHSCEGGRVSMNRAKRGGDFGQDTAKKVKKRFDILYKLLYNISIRKRAV